MKQDTLLTDIKQSFIGAFGSVLFFFALRTDPIAISYLAGMLITSVWLFFLWRGFNGHRTRKLNYEFIVSLSVSIVVAVSLSLLFGLITPAMIFTKEIFSSSVVIAIWIATPVSLLFNKKNLNSILSRYQFMAQKK